MAHADEVTSECIRVVSELGRKGAYVTTLHVADDTSIVLERDRALRYATTVVTAAQYAAYDQALYAQAAGHGATDDNTVWMVGHLRDDRPPLDDDATEPLRFEPLCDSHTRTGGVAVWLGGRALSVWSIAETEQHALAVLGAAAVVDLDAGYRRFLIGKFGMAARRAAGTVEDLRRWRSGSSAVDRGLR